MNERDQEASEKEELTKLDLFTETLDVVESLGSTRDKKAVGSANRHVLPKLSKRSSEIGIAKAMLNSMNACFHGSESQLIHRLLSHVFKPSIAPTILEFAIGGAPTHSEGRSFATLYMALHGQVIPLGDTCAAIDPARREWWLRAMVDHVTGQWAATQWV